MAIRGYGRKFGYRFQDKTVKSLAMPFVTKMENRSSIRKQGIYSTVRLTTSLRRRGCGQAPAGVRLRLPPVGKNSLPHRPLIVKRLSRHKRREFIALADPRDEKEESFIKAAPYTNILVTNQENNPFVRKKDCFPETAQKCRPYCIRTNPYGYIFALCAKKFTKSSYIALFPGLFS